VTDTGIVTPEAVVLAFDTAGLGSRMIAKLIDLLIQGVALIAFLVGGAALGSTPVGLALVYFGLFAVLFGYPVAIETLWRGKSVGKAAMGLRVVTVEGAPIRFRHALIRGALALIELYATSGAVAVFFVLGTKRNQRLGDLVAGTLVLRERTGAAMPSAATFWVPRGWETYAATLDVSGLTATEYQAVRSFLLRAPTLDPWTRDRVARDLANPVTRRLRHHPPSGVSAEGFLACVAALYQQRQRRAAPPAGVGWGPPSPGAPPAGSGWGSPPPAAPPAGAAWGPPSPRTPPAGSGWGSPPRPAVQPQQAVQPAPAGQPQPAVPVAVGGSASPWAPSGQAAPPSGRGGPTGAEPDTGDAPPERSGGFIPPA